MCDTDPIETAGVIAGASGPRPLRSLVYCTTNSRNAQDNNPKRDRRPERQALSPQESFHTRRESVGLIGKQCVPRIFDPLDSALRHRLLEPFRQLRRYDIAVATVL